MKAVAVWVLFCLSVGWAARHETEYTNDWVAEIHGGEKVAQRVAASLGYKYTGPVTGFDDYYEFRRLDQPAVSKRNCHHLTRHLTELPEVKWAEQQTIVRRSSRGVIPSMLEEQQGLAAQSRLGTFSSEPSPASQLATYTGPTKHMPCFSNMSSAYKHMFNDPFWVNQWYFQDCRTENIPVMDLNIVPVYKQGYTGRGVTVAVVDDGVQNGHPDLEGNFDFYLSYDMVNDTIGSDPDPNGLGPGIRKAHGTKCAGEIAMLANNNLCGVGVSFNAKVCGIKVLGQGTSEIKEAKGLVHKLDKIDIFSSSWGPTDDGTVMEKVGRMTTVAFRKGSLEGRGGKGSIYLFAGGNGKHLNDNCGVDGLINNLYTISISSVSQKGKTVFYSERCPAIFAGVYASGNGKEEKIVATDLDGGCSATFSGTSAATPLAAGIFALTLEANPDLTYRDLMHIITMSAEVAPVADNEDVWYKNARGFWVSNDFGYGLLNAENMVNLAKTWKTVPKINTCVVKFTLSEPQYITVGQNAVVQLRTKACQDSATNAVYYLEQVELGYTVQYPYRGAISLSLKSPSGTKTTMLESRPLDDAQTGYNSWVTKSLHQWGENPKGIWEIEVMVNQLTGIQVHTGNVQEFNLTFHGTVDEPAHYTNLPRKYAAFRLPDGKTSEVSPQY